jgi:hypothetical protein
MMGLEQMLTQDRTTKTGKDGKKMHQNFSESGLRRTSRF